MIREKPASTTGTTMLKDLVYCGVCGRKMRIFFDDKSSTGYVIQRCYHLYNGEKCPNRGIKLELVEKEVTKALPNFKSLLEKSVQRLQQEKEAGVETDIKRKIKQQERKLNDLNEQQDKLIDLALKGIFNEEEIRNKKQELIDEIKYTESAIVDLKEKIGNIDLNDHINSLMNIIELIEKLPNMEPDEVNQSLKTFISKIVYTRVLPPELLKKSTRNKQRKEYPFEIEIEFIE
ncbi:zinc ribbon domain-containing protein [Bacillus licheniformis]|uniref:zinc ribbon domain-containing protein n=1 Tax=Bacillus licheniformis TaxID=1402 RepID=UPI001CD9837C|nr:zinc ribbon domain-containing protein [Bacillus licheniformis]MDQ9095371.1 recombinase zinc beta ribbon domain-containing protein [Bacillus licheniformis]